MGDESRTIGSINRVRSISFSNFRGFKSKNHKVNTNADLVLISGPNGYGKSSFLEGLLLVLTGWHDESRNTTKDLIALPANENGVESFKIEAEVSDKTNADKNSTGNISIDWLKDEPTKLDRSKVKGLPESLIGGDCELEARLCGFFQDRVDILFDQAGKGYTLRDVFDPLAKWIKNVQNYFKQEFSQNLNAKKTKIKEKQPEEDLQTVSDKLKREWNGFAEIYRELATKKDSFPKTPPDGTEERNIAVFARQVLESAGILTGTNDYNLIKKLKQTIIKELNDLIYKARLKVSGTTGDLQEIEKNLKEIKKQINEIKGKYPDLSNKLSLFKAEDPDDPDMAAVFRVLLRNAESWSQIDTAGFFGDKSELSGDGRLKRVLEEFKAVLPDEAGKCLHAIDLFLGPLKKAEKELIRHGKVKRELEKKRSKAKSSDKIKELEKLRKDIELSIDPLQDAWQAKQDWNDWLSKQKHRENALSFLEEIEKLRKKFFVFADNLTKPSEEMRKTLEKIANLLINQFSLVEGFSPLNFIQDSDKNDRYIYRIKTKDNRGTAHFSTGQRSQAAVAFLTAQNLMISSKLSHRIIILDDVTTSYDLSNLTREALLWRHMAYGMEGNQARQVFISSHHEDLTNHLLDLLVPPEGCSMRLLKFDGWSPENGPEINSYNVTPTREAQKDTGVRSAFAEALKELKW